MPRCAKILTVLILGVGTMVDCSLFFSLYLSIFLSKKRQSLNAPLLLSCQLAPTYFSTELSQLPLHNDHIY